MKVHIEMTLLKECKSCYRYEAKGQVVNTLYIAKSALKAGEQPPKVIGLTVTGLE